VGVSESVRRRTRNGITELSQRAPPIFSWAAITLGIGTHSSLKIGPICLMCLTFCCKTHSRRRHHSLMPDACKTFCHDSLQWLHIKSPTSTKFTVGQADSGRAAASIFPFMGDRMYKSSAAAEMRDRLATIDIRHGPESGACCAPFRAGEPAPHLTQCGLGRGLPSHQVAS